MLRTLLQRKWIIGAGFGAFVALIAAACVARLAAGPVDAPWLEGAVVRTLEAQVAGGRAKAARVRLVWFDADRSLGLALDGVRLVDGKGREVLDARRLEVGLALDSLPGFRPALGRLVMRDASAALSISPKGEYALGFDAAGVPSGKSELSGLLGDLTGRSRLGRPASYLRDLDVENVRLAFRQVSGPVAWTAQVRTLRFQKVGGRLAARADISLDDGRKDQNSAFDAGGSAAVGLSNAHLWGRVDNLVPARVFPTVGSAAPLSTLYALVSGRGSISYDFRSGVRAADVSLSAGRGEWRMGPAFQSFENAQLVANFDPRSGDVILRSLELTAEKTRLDLGGSFHLTPQDTRRKTPARLDFSLSGPRLLATLAGDAPPQELNDVRIIGRYTPELRRIELRNGSGLLAGAPVRAAAVFYQNNRGAWGVRLNGVVGGQSTPEQVFAFWPRPLVTPVRDWLRRAVLSGRLTNATFVINAPPGEFSRPALRNEDLRISFDFQDAAIRFADKIPPISSGVGRGVVQGNRFDLALASGRMESVALSQGSIEIAAFKPDGGVGKFKAHARGDAHAILAILDRPPLGLFTPHGFSPDRVSGDAEGDFEIDRPMLFEVPVQDYRIRYNAMVRNGVLKHAALGWDLTDGVLRVLGDEDKVTVTGVGTLGPYRGGVEFSTRYQGAGDRSLAVNLNGAVSASIVGGRPGRTAPFGGRFRYGDGEGVGLVHSAIFDGRLAWKDGDGPNRVQLNGWGAGQALRKLGAPFTEGMPGRFPVSLRLARSRGVWKGPLLADALSGSVAFVEGSRPRLVYDADISPADARRLGFAGMPLFEQPRHVMVDASWSGPGGAAQVRAGGVGFSLGWGSVAGGQTERRLRANLDSGALASLGLPSGFVRPGTAALVTASWRDTADGAAGNADLDGVPVRFQLGAGRGDARVITVRADFDRNQLHRFGAPDLIEIDGSSTLTARVAMVQRAVAGRLDLDLGHTALSVLHSDWRKPAGQNAHLFVDLVRGGDGTLRLTHISSQGPGVDVDGSAVLSPSGRLVSVDLPRLRLSGVMDAAVRAGRDANGLTLSVRGRSLDARRLVDRASEPAGSASGQGAEVPVRIEAALGSLRLTDDAVFRDVRASGVWAGASPRLDVTALTAGGGKVSGRVAPDANGAAITAQASDAGDLARTLFGVSSLKGGAAVLNGRLVQGGADLNVEMKNVRVVKAPAMAQLLTMASLRGLADTLNGEGVMFTTVKAPLEIRGRKLMVGESRASGPALGITTKGVADLGSGSLDFQGVIVPAYGINSVVGHVPVLGQLLTSRKGEGVLGLSYAAKGPIEKPQIYVNPLSLVTPGILRRVFESPTPAVDRTDPATRARRVSVKGKPAGPP
jgi:hypothetical protein